jgi:DNA-binding NarL/FixJ family response regulator
MSVENFVFYKNWFDSIKALNNRELENEVLRAIVEYGVEGELSNSNNGVVNMTFGLIKPQIDNAKNNYLAKVEGGKNAGRKRSYTDEQVQMLIDKGLRADEIAEELGVSRDTIYKTEPWRNRKR